MRDRIFERWEKETEHEKLVADYLSTEIANKVLSGLSRMLGG
jgi:hypothetical protein